MGDGTCAVFLNADWNAHGADDGEGDELLPALQDEEKLKSLLDEFGLLG